MTVESCIMFVYSADAYKTHLLQTVLIEVHSRSTLYTKAMPGAVSHHTVTLP